ncbi:unnamed protein product [Trichobilharzia regenti]|nr:unnamed protein product [Trichobilharzia regenti]
MSVQSSSSSYFTRLVPFTSLASSKSPSFLLLSRNGLQVLTSKSFQHASMPVSLMAYSKYTTGKYESSVCCLLKKKSRSMFGLMEIEFIIFISFCSGDD